MPRRTLTLLLGTVLAFALAFGASITKVPYVALGPGPAYNTLGSVETLGAKGKKVSTPLLRISGRPTYPTNGELALTTVGVTTDITLAEALRGWLSRSTEIVPREVLFPPGKTSKEVDAENQHDMAQSQNAATTAALTELGIPAKTTLSVGSVLKGAPADGRLQAGDVVTSVDGTKVTSSDQLRALISARKPGRPVTIGYLREGVAATVVVTTAASRQAPVHAEIGITPETSSTFPVKVTISLQDVGGPSAGLMFALGILDKLEKGSLTGGRNVAGTGEINDGGKVSPIGGIAEKMIGAKRHGATVFLVPADNCADAKASTPHGLRLIKVGSLKDALTGLRTLRAGGTPISC